MDISKKQFKAYEDVRTSGITNMFMVKTVSDLSGLNRLEILEIMHNYTSLKQKYGN